jgi:phosphoglycolate phosphatase-like HAD superfamily hydrolase
VKLVLFDIDGTLIDAAGAGRRAFNRALERLLGVVNPLDGVPLDGRTDTLILHEVLARVGRLDVFQDIDLLRHLYGLYVQILEEELAAAGDGDYRVLPGVYELLEYLSASDRFLLGLATGNLVEGAWVKLRPGRLDRYFSFGGFGDGALSRTDVVRRAVEEGRRRVRPNEPLEPIVIGDTPLDVEHARKAGAKAIAVATGRYRFDELQRLGPDLVVESLSPIEPVLEFLEA